jgi:hypothetical protein
MSIARSAAALYATKCIALVLQVLAMRGSTCIGWEKPGTAHTSWL